MKRFLLVACLFLTACDVQRAEFAALDHTQCIHLFAATGDETRVWATNSMVQYSGNRVIFKDYIYPNSLVSVSGTVYVTKCNADMK